MPQQRMRAHATSGFSGIRPFFGLSGIDAVYRSQHFFVIHNIFPGGKVLLIPEGIAGMVVGKGQQGDFYKASRTQDFSCALHQLRCDALPAVVGIDRQMVQKPASPVLAA